MNISGNHSAAVLKALKFLRVELQYVLSSKKKSLPSLVKLAQRAPVSVFTLQKTVSILCKDKILVSEPGVAVYPGPFVQKFISMNMQPVSNKSRAQKISELIHQHILQNRYAPGSNLPSAYTLAIEVGSCYRTVRKALIILEESNIIQPYKRGYKIPGVVKLKRTKTLLMLSLFPSIKEIAQDDERTIAFCTTLEQAVSVRNMHIKVISIKNANPNNTGWIRQMHSIQKNEVIAGIMVLLDFLILDSFDTFVQHLMQFKLPVAMIDFYRTRPNLPNVSNIKKMRLFTTYSNEKVGRDIAGYLAALGHRKIAWISPRKDFWYNQERLKGICSKFENKKLCHVYSFEKAVPYSLEAVDKIVQQVSFKAALAKLNNKLYELTDTSFVHESDYTFYNMYKEFIKKKNVESQTYPLFKEALEQKDVTVWICANDVHANNAMSFLKLKNIKVPQQISIVGFDDSTTALFNDIDSYNFNPQQVAQEAVSFIFESDKSHTPHEIPGFIVQRGSVRKI